MSDNKLRFTVEGPGFKNYNIQKQGIAIKVNQEELDPIKYLENYFNALMSLYRHEVQKVLDTENSFINK